MRHNVSIYMFKHLFNIEDYNPSTIREKFND
nr:hypothetical protein [Mucilaginibacter sp. X5P1]